MGRDRRHGERAGNAPHDAAAHDGYFLVVKSRDPDVRRHLSLQAMLPLIAPGANWARPARRALFCRLFFTRPSGGRRHEPPPPGGQPVVKICVRAAAAPAHQAAFGISRQQMPMVAQSMLLGGHVRVGLEDNLYLGYKQRFVCSFVCICLFVRLFVCLFVCLCEQLRSRGGRAASFLCGGVFVGFFDAAPCYGLGCEQQLCSFVG